MNRDRPTLILVLFAILLIGCKDEVKEVLAPNSVTDGLEEGEWLIYDENNERSYSTGKFNTGSKVNRWKYVRADTSYSVVYKRNPVRANGLSLGVPVFWYEIKSEDFDFVAVDTISSDVTVIANVIDAPSDTTGILDFVEIALLGITDSPTKVVVNCTVQKVALSNGEEIIIGRVVYFDNELGDRRAYRFIYKHLSGQRFLDASVAGNPSDSSRLSWVFNDFLSNIVADGRKVLPYGHEPTEVSPLECD